MEYNTEHNRYGLFPCAVYALAGETHNCVSKGRTGASALIKEGKGAAERSVVAAQPGESCRMRANLEKDNSKWNVPMALGTLTFRKWRCMSSCE